MLVLFPISCSFVARSQGVQVPAHVCIDFHFQDCAVVTLSISKPISPRYHPLVAPRAPGSRTGPVLKRGDKMMASEPQDVYRDTDPLQSWKNATLTAHALTGIEWK